MTEKQDIKRRWGLSLLLLICLFFLLLLLKVPRLATVSIEKGLRLCATAVIPSLFPFMVLTDLLIAFGIDRPLGKLFGKPLGRLFGISDAGVCAALLGLFCGFPIGARSALSLYDKREISKEECEHLLGFTSLPSMAFLVSFVGSSLLGSTRLGVLLWLCCLASAVTVGAIGRKKRAPLFGTPLPVTTPSLSKALPNAVTGAMGAMLTVCAYILFFCTVCDCLTEIWSTVSLSPVFGAWIFDLVELTSGCVASAALPSPLSAAGLCGFAAGFSGFSVHCQLLSLADGRALRFGGYFRDKLLMGMLCGTLMLVLSPLVP